MFLLKQYTDAQAVTPTSAQAAYTLFLNTLNQLAVKDSAGVVTLLGGSGTGIPGSIWRVGSTVPANTLGVNGDLYLKSDDGAVYQKAAGAYTVVANIKGATGPTGPTGPAGAGGASATLQTTLTAAATLGVGAIGNLTPYNSAANANITVPSDSTLGLAANSAVEITLFMQSTGVPTLVGASGVTVNKSTDYPINTQFSYPVIQHVGVNTWAYK